MASVDDPVSHDAARHVETAVLALPGVAGLSSGEFSEIALLYPGARVRGLRLSDPGVVPRLEVHVVVDLRAAGNLHELSERVRAAAAAHVRFPVDVIVADAVDGPASPAAPSPRRKK
jgi:hypothetical protein